LYLLAVWRNGGELIPGEDSRTTSFVINQSRFSKARWLVFQRAIERVKVEVVASEIADMVTTAR
jgi:type IV secretory pathway TrbF-like protein